MSLPLIAYPEEQKAFCAQFESVFRGLAVAWFSGHGNEIIFRQTLIEELFRWTADPDFELYVVERTPISLDASELVVRFVWPKRFYWQSGAQHLWEGFQCELKQSFDHEVLARHRMAAERRKIIGTSASAVVTPPPGPLTNEDFAQKMRRKRDSGA